jgi:D-tyrosyl-tRNA(Tyr) deacylase
VIQRVSEASVTVVESDGSTRLAGAIGHGLLILVGIAADDTEADAVALGEKAATLRIFEDEAGKLNLGLLEVGGSALVVSNFTLFGDCRKGRRPSFTQAASGEQAKSLYLRVGAVLKQNGIPVEYGEFGATMRVALVNDGPITLLLDSRKLF